MFVLYVANSGELEPNSYTKVAEIIICTANTKRTRKTTGKERE